ELTSVLAPNLRVAPPADHSPHRAFLAIGEYFSAEMPVLPYRLWRWLSVLSGGRRAASLAGGLGCEERLSVPLAPEGSGTGFGAEDTGAFLSCSASKGVRSSAMSWM